MSTPAITTAHCDRCNRLLQVSTTRREDSKPFRRSLAPKGLCPECVVTEFLYNTYPLNQIIDQAGPELLLRGGVQGWSNPKANAVKGNFIAQALVASGLMDHCEMSIEEINWQRLVDNWSLPVQVPKNGRNPYRMGESKRDVMRPPLPSPAGSNL